jgi:hypothetical protein
MSKYNGWTNYETWNVNLWMSESFYEVGLHQRTSDAYELGKMLEEHTDEWVEILHPGLLDSASFVVDMVTASLRDVNWYEIAEHYLADVFEEVAP